MRCPTLNELPPPPPGKTAWPWTEDSPQLPDTTSDGKPWPKISIVTPSYNQGQFIEETIRSVLLQGYPNLEYIIIDGDSSDDSVSIIRKYEFWLAYWTSTPDKGQSDAINKGLGSCNGEIVTWLNSDDILYPGAFMEAVAYFHRNPEIGLIYGNFDKINDQSCLIEHVVTQDYDFFKIASSRIGSGICQPGTFFRKRVIASVGLLRDDLHFAMDFEYWIRVGLHFPIKRIPVTMAAFRIYEGTKSVSNLSKFPEEHLKVIDDLFRKPDLPPEVLNIKNQIYSGNYFRGGIYFYRSSNINAARLWFLKSIVSYPKEILKTDIITWFLKTFIGNRLYELLNRTLKRVIEYYMTFRHNLRRQ